jgi:ferritin-like metal-binding protein YciE
MAIESIRDVYRHQLGEVYHAEQLVLSVLDRIELETGSAALRDRVRTLRRETLRQVDNVERCFELAGASAPRVESETARGIVAERERFLEEQPTEQVLELYNLHCIARLGALKRESYRQLARMAGAIRQDDAGRLLAANLREEEELGRWLDENAAALVETRPSAPSRV